MCYLIVWADKVFTPPRVKGGAPFFFPIFISPPCVGDRGGRRGWRGRWRGLPLGQKPPFSQQIILTYYLPWVLWGFMKIGSSLYRGRPHLNVGHHLAVPHRNVCAKASSSCLLVVECNDEVRRGPACVCMWDIQPHSTAACMPFSNGHGFGSNRTEPLSHGLTIYWFYKKKWFGFSINGLVSFRFGSKTRVYRFIGLV